VRVRGSLLLSFLLLPGPCASAQNVQIGVLGLFHPHQITLSATRGEAIVLTAADRSFVLGPGSGVNAAEIRFSGIALLIDFGGEVVQASEIRAAGRNNGPVNFVLAVPGKISRFYRGTLVMKAVGGVIVPIVNMDLETAVASAVQAESDPDAPPEALKAQAVVARSYFTAGGGRHRNFDFCDLTHCQSLREPPAPDSPAAAAAIATRGLVITFEEKPVAAMFARSCGGRTRTPAELGLPAKGYPYFAVVCDYCHKNPAHWTRRISRQDAALLLGKGEAGRLAVDRRLGWNAVPSNNYTARPENGEVVLKGAGQGHGIGLCQRGAKAMAAEGASFRQILNHYYPNTTVTSLSEPHAP
jgi:hypothetical protein